MEPKVKKESRKNPALSDLKKLGSGKRKKGKIFGWREKRELDSSADFYQKGAERRES